MKSIRNLNIIFSCLFLLSTYWVNAQEKSIFIEEHTKLAEQFYNGKDYKKAARHYRKVLSKADSLLDLKIKLAQSYRKAGLADSAIVWYESVVDSISEDELDQKLIFDYSQALVSSKKYERAIKLLSKSDEPRARHYKHTISNIADMLKDSGSVYLETPRFNSASNEFAPILYDSGIIIVSDRGKISGEGKGFDLHYFSLIPGDETSSGSFLAPLNSRFGEGPLTYAGKAQMMIFTRSAKNKEYAKGEEKIHRLQLYESKKEGGKYLKPVPLSFNNKKYSVGHPTVNETGDVLYFVSDMPGGYGGTDVYKTELINGDWKKPENLGPNVNTVGDEMFPFLYDEETLYIASNGIGGFGGLDIFRIDLKQNNAALNLGYPFNTAYDDFGYISSVDGYSGYFTSNRPGGKGGDDIYEFFNLKRYINGEVKGMEDEVLEDVIVEVIDPEGNSEELMTDEQGEFHYPGRVGNQYKIVMHNDEYERQEIVVNLTDTTDVQITAVLKPIEKEKEITTVEVVPVDITKPIKLVYKVQIGAAVVRMTKEDLEQRGYNGSLEILGYYEDIWYKYAIGEFDTFEEALALKKTCNVGDAFVVVFKENRKVDTEFTLMNKQKE